MIYYTSPQVIDVCEALIWSLTCDLFVICRGYLPHRIPMGSDQFYIHPIILFIALTEMRSSRILFLTVYLNWLYIIETNSVMHHNLTNIAICPVWTIPLSIYNITNCNLGHSWEGWWNKNKTKKNQTNKQTTNSPPQKNYKIRLPFLCPAIWIVPLIEFSGKFDLFLLYLYSQASHRANIKLSDSKNDIDWRSQGCGKATSQNGHQILSMMWWIEVYHASELCRQSLQGEDCISHLQESIWFSQWLAESLSIHICPGMINQVIPGGIMKRMALEIYSLWSENINSMNYLPRPFFN